MHWFIPLIAAALPTYMIRLTIAGIPTTVLELLIYLSLAGILIGRPWAAIGERLRPYCQRYGWPIAFFFLAAVVSSFISPDLRQALGLLKAYIIDPLILFIVILIWTDSPERKESIIYGLLAGGLVVALSALVMPAAGRALGLYAYDVNPSPNYPALFLAPIAAISLGVLSHKRLNGQHRAWLGVGTALMLAAIIQTGSRAALAAFAVALGVAIIRFAAFGPLKKWKGLYKPALTIFAAIVIASGAILARPDFSSQANTRETTSNNLRSEIWRTTLVDIIPRKPLLGVGLGNFQSFFTDLTAQRINFPEFISPWARTPHNFFLTIWTNLGILGLIAIVWLLVIFFQERYKNKKNALNFALTAGMIALLAHGMLDAPYWKNDLAALFWIILALGALNEEV